MDDATTWKLIHRERAAMADTLATLTPEQWRQPSLCGGWTVRDAAGHIVTGAEQTKRRFMTHMAANGFRFNRMMDVDAKRTAARPPDVPLGTYEQVRVALKGTLRLGVIQVRAAAPRDGHTRARLLAAASDSHP